MTVAWTSTVNAGTGLSLRPLDIHGIDFLFVGTVVVGLYAIHRILAVTERAMAGRRVVLAALLEQLQEQMPQPLRVVTTVPSVRDLVYFPFSMLSRVLPERRRSNTMGLGLHRRASDRPTSAAPEGP